MAVRAVLFGQDSRAMVAQVQAFRAKLFVDHHRWQLRVVDGLEIDEFDGPNTLHCALQQDGEIQGCFRLIRTDQPYLARTIFPKLAVVRPYPIRPDVWEVSRFGVRPGNRAADLGRINYAVMFAFAQRMNAGALVAVASPDHERFLRLLGIRTRRYGPPDVVGLDHAGRPLRAVAGEIVPAMQDPIRLQALLELIENMEIVDASDVFRPGRISA